MSQLTAISRSRDAARAFLHPQTSWPSDLNKELFRSLWEQISVSAHGTDQFVFRKQGFASATATLLDGVDVPFSNDPNALLIDGQDAELVRAVCICKDRGFITDQVTVTNCPDDIRINLELEFPDIVWLDGETPTIHVLL